MPRSARPQTQLESHTRPTTPSREASCRSAQGAALPELLVFSSPFTTPPSTVLPHGFFGEEATEEGLQSADDGFHIGTRVVPKFPTHCNLRTAQLEVGTCKIRIPKRLRRKKLFSPAFYEPFSGREGGVSLFGGPVRDMTPPSWTVHVFRSG
jgi:hypothetical protein